MEHMPIPPEYPLPDMSNALDRIVPESFPWLHTDEGPESVARLLSGVMSSSDDPSLATRMITLLLEHSLFLMFV